MSLAKRTHSCFHPQRQILPISGEAKIWKMYKIESAEIEKAVEEKYKKFQLVPENHWKYREEWVEFWLQRCQELQREGISTINYNFRPEWRKFFIERLKSFESLEIREKLQNLSAKCIAITGMSSEGNSENSKRIEIANKSPKWMKKRSFYEFKTAMSSQGKKNR